MKVGLFCGSFDPPTLGHIDIIQRALKICDKLIIGVAVNTSKKSYALFTSEEKKSLLELALNNSSIEIVLIDGLVTDFAKGRSVSFLIRGIRAFDDYEQEFRMALTNRKLSNIETIFLLSDERLSHISSTLIKEMAKNQKRLLDFVPKEIEEIVFVKISSH
jgi:pantetheine-phosphate adenylyltransferase